MSGESDRDILPGSLESSSTFVAVASFVEMINPQEARKELGKGWPGQRQEEAGSGL